MVPIRKRCAILDVVIVVSGAAARQFLACLDRPSASGQRFHPASSVSVVSPGDAPGLLLRRFAAFGKVFGKLRDCSVAQGHFQVILATCFFVCLMVICGTAGQGALPLPQPVKRSTKHGERATGCATVCPAARVFDDDGWVAVTQHPPAYRRTPEAAVPRRGGGAPSFH